MGAENCSRSIVGRKDRRVCFVLMTRLSRIGGEGPPPPETRAAAALAASSVLPARFT
jgi:hypothetical protein